MDELEERVRSLAEPVLARHGAELVDLQVRRGRTSLVRIVADQPGGIDVDTCATVSEELSRMLDVEDPIPFRYTLEVTSPGLDRPLRSREDFLRNVGRDVRVTLADRQVDGRIEEVGEDGLRLRVGAKPAKPGRKVAAGEPVEIALADIVQATVLLPW